MRFRVIAFRNAVTIGIFCAVGGATNPSAAVALFTDGYLSVYAVKASLNNRYLVDQNNAPFIIVGDSPDSLIGRMSKSTADFYMTNRHRYGINTLCVELLCNEKTGCNADGTTFDGISPFTISGDISTPDPLYFQRVDDLLAIAAAHGITILLDAVETAGWLAIFRANGAEKAATFGRYLGNRYKDLPKIIWMYGNDFQTWSDPGDDTIVLGVAMGIKSPDPNHIHTTELNYLSGGSFDDPRWEQILGPNGAYTYYLTCAQVLKEYSRPNFRPVFLVKANYEFEHNLNTDGGSIPNLRHQEYWTMLFGAIGQRYASAFTWRLPSGWFFHWRL